MEKNVIRPYNRIPRNTCARSWYPQNSYHYNTWISRISLYDIRLMQRFTYLPKTYSYVHKRTRCCLLLPGGHIGFITRWENWPVWYINIISWNIIKCVYYTVIRAILVARRKSSLLWISLEIIWIHPANTTTFTAIIIQLQEVLQHKLCYSTILPNRNPAVGFWNDII